MKRLRGAVRVAIHVVRVPERQQAGLPPGDETGPGEGGESFAHDRRTAGWRLTRPFSGTRRAVAQMYDKLLGKARGEYVETKIKDGVFGAMMQVSLTNDGPVTLQLDSQHPKPA